MTTKADAAEILAGLRLLLAPGSVAELRCPKTERGTVAGYFDDLQALATEACDLSGKVAGVYLTLNPVNPALLARAVNRIKPYMQNTTTDADILTRHWLPLDFDAVRPAGISSTDSEHATALERAEDCKRWLSGQGFPEPLFADSGNGAHLLYRIELPNDAATAKLIKQALAALAQKFSDPRVTLDVDVFNAARIWKVYGTRVQKGDATTERPHRFARLLETPAEITVLTRQQLRQIAALAKPVAAGPRKKASGKVFDIAGWLDQHGIAVESQGPWEEGTRYILAACPLNPEHTRTAYVVQFANGALAAGCHHASCAGLDWKTLRGLYEPQAEAPELSEDALALEFTRQHGGDSKFTAAMGCWHRWTGNFWEQDERLRTFTLARAICRDTANATAEPDKSRRLASSATVSAVERLARYDDQHAVGTEQWDADPWLLNTPAATVDLRTGEMRAHSRSDFITKICTASPAGDCPLWLEFLHRVTGCDSDLQAFLQRMTGYCLTGITREHAMFFLYGTGANGKTTFVNTLVNLLGPYTRTAPIETLLASRNSSDRHPCDLAALRGARLVTAVEVESGGRWAEAKITNLTGGDRIAARFLYTNFFEFTPQFKLIVAGNHRPALRNVNEAIRRRFHLVPFTVTIPPEERDRELPEKLRAEYPGILAWAIAGCLAWQQRGLDPPAVVRDATQAYFCDEDVLGRWIAERCVLGPNFKTISSALFADWKRWTEEAGEFTGSQKNFSQHLESQAGISHFRSSRAAGFRGIRLRAPGDTDEEHSNGNGNLSELEESRREEAYSA